MLTWQGSGGFSVDASVRIEIRTEALWHRQHPLPCGHVRQQVVGEVP
jgi:hypothetical protein